MQKEQQIILKEELVTSNEITKIEKAQRIEIANAEDMKGATALLSELNKANDRIVAEKEKITKPLNEALKVERARWKPAETLLEGAITAIRSKMSAYQSAMIAKQREEEAKIASRIGEGKGKLKMETAIKKIDNVDKPEDKVKTDEGSVTFKTVKKFRIIKIDRIPRVFMMPDEKKIQAQCDADLVIEGVEFYEEQIVINRRK